MDALRVKLLTSINVQSAKVGSLKRKRDPRTDWHAVAKSAKVVDKATARSQTGAELAGTEDDETLSAFKTHFAAECSLLSGAVVEAAKAGSWNEVSSKLQALEDIVELLPEGTSTPTGKGSLHIKQLAALKAHTQTSGESISALQAALVDLVSSYRDLLYTHVTLDNHDELRAALAAHAMSHVAQTRARVLKNNERIAHADATPLDPAIETRDQGFTRPKVLVLLPLRNSALAWIRLLASMSGVDQVENMSRLEKDFSLPEGTVDKLAEDVDVGARYPRDHAITFQGNIDDNFRVGLKLTRKSLKLYSEFYSSDIIVASPLGLRTTIEDKGESGADFLSSIEMIIADQLDVMLMQNFEHVEFVYDHLNLKPVESRDTDFSRVKPWYLEGQAALLRQTIMLSSYDAPELRSLLGGCLNVAGKVRTEPSTDEQGVLMNVRKGVRQTFVRFEVDETDPVASEDDRRFDHFTSKTLPGLIKSAVSSSHTLILVPSYFDFVRVKAYLNDLDDFSFAAISEYSTNAEVTRARSHFVNGKADYLVMTERLHFFRRYRVRGAKTIVSYAPPEHAHFYSELLSFPFADNLDESEVSSQVVFSRLDALKLRRIVGAEDAERLCNDEGTRFTFV